MILLRKRKYTFFLRNGSNDVKWKKIHPVLFQYSGSGVRNTTELPGAARTNGEHGSPRLERAHSGKESQRLVRAHSVEVFRRLVRERAHNG